MTREKGLIITARVISIIFTPFYLPLVGITLLLSLTFLSKLPTDYKLMLAALVYIMTVFMPTMMIFIYRLFRKWTSQQLAQKNHRIVPYAISIFCYLACAWQMQQLHVDHALIAVVIAALFIQAACVLVNFFWKVSTHVAAIGGVTGALVAFSTPEYPFMFNPLGWLCLSIFVAGMVGTARMILRQHTLSQVVIGYFIGIAAAFLTIMNI